MVAQNPCKPAVLAGGIWCCLDVSFPSDIWWEVMEAPLSSILSQYHNIPTSYPQMPATFQWNSWLSFMTLEYQTGLGNGSSSRWLKGEVPSHNELTLYWSPGRVRHNGKWGRMARHFPLCCRETLGSRAEWWRYKNNALEQMSANFFCPQPDCKILGFAGHMMAVRSSQCSIAAWKQP